VKPVITSVSPSSGVAGTTLPITISGTGFGTSPEVSVDDGTSVAVNSSNGTSISATMTIPSAATGGSHNLSVTVAGQTSAAFMFQVRIPTYFEMLGLTPVVGCGSGEVGLAVSATYQVLDQNSSPIQLAGMTPLENAPGTYGQFLTFATPPTTSTTGSFVDTPVTTCFQSPVTQTTCVNVQQTFELAIGTNPPYPIVKGNEPKGMR